MNVNQNMPIATGSKSSSGVLFQWNEFSARDACTPSFLPPFVALLLRIAMLGLTIWFVIDAADHYAGTMIDIKSTIAFAHLIMIVIYFGLGVLVHLIHLSTVNSVKNGEGASDPVPLGFKLHWIYFEMVFVIALIITGVHWLIYDELMDLGAITYQRISLYIMNVVLLSLDFLLINRYIPLVSHTCFVIFGICIIMLAIYLTKVYAETEIIDFYYVVTPQPARFFNTIFVGIGIHIALCAVGILKSRLLSSCCSGTRVGAGNIPGPACAVRNDSSLLSDYNSSVVDVDAYGARQV